MLQKKRIALAVVLCVCFCSWVENGYGMLGFRPYKRKERIRVFQLEERMPSEIFPQSVLSGTYSKLAIPRMQNFVARLGCC